MKIVQNLFFLVAAILATGTAAAQSNPATSAKGPVITWEKSMHDFGDLQNGDKVEYTFKFTNTGTEPLIITNVTVTCGCTTPKGWPRDPIAAGNSGEITLAFDSHNKLGKLTKVVTIISNAVNPDGSQIMFTANVLEKKSPQ